MSKKGDFSVPYIFDDEDIQTNFIKNFFTRPIARGRSFYLENFTTLPKVHEVFEFQGWSDFLRIFENIYTGLVPTDEDNISLRSIVGSFEIEVLPSNIAQITDTPNDDILCRPRDKWWEKLGAIEEKALKSSLAKETCN